MCKVRLAMVILLALFPMVGTAGTKGWTAQSSIKAVVVTIQGGINVQVEPMLTGCVSLSGYGEKYASIYPSHEGIDRMYSALMAAASSGKKVMLYLGDDTCKITEIRVLY